MRSCQRLYCILLLTLIVLASCGDADDAAELPADTGERVTLTFALDVDPTQARLDNVGRSAEMAPGNAGQTPEFHFLAASYLELTPTALTPLGGGLVLYRAATTSAGGDEATDFDQLDVLAPGDDFFSVPLADIEPGTYEYVRVALAYQEFSVQAHVETAGLALDLTGRVASFLEDEMYISSFLLGDQEVEVFANKEQGYWAFYSEPGGLRQGQAPRGATTVPNPIADTSPTDPISCIVTGRFDPPLVITGTEGEDVAVTLSLSSNLSFEWRDSRADGLWEPLADELVVDMGVRGLQPRVTSP